MTSTDAERRFEVFDAWWKNLQKTVKMVANGLLIWNASNFKLEI